MKIFADNQSAARIVSVGSSKVHLQSVALRIFCFCFLMVLEAGSLTRMIGGSIPPCFEWLMLNGVPTRSTVLPPIKTLSFRVSTPNLLLPVAPVLMPWSRIGVERITGFALPHFGRPRSDTDLQVSPVRFSQLPKIQNIGFACGFSVSCWWCYG